MRGVTRLSLPLRRFATTIGQTEYTFSAGSANYFKTTRQLFDIEMAKRDERKIEYDRTKNDPTDLDDFTVGPKPWLNPHMPSNKSLLPVQLNYIQRHVLPFDYKLETNIPNPNEDQDYPSWQPYWFKSKLSFELDDVDLNDFEKEIFKELIGPRYNRKTGRVSFVSKHLATRQANENRVYQYVEHTREYAKRLAARFEAENASASSSSSSSESSE